MKYLQFLLTILLFTGVAIAQQNMQQRLDYPVTAKMEQFDDYFGVKVSDPYRWLEETNSPETKSWVNAQNKVTFDYLSKIPYREKIKNRLTEIWDYPKYSQPFKGGNNYFFYKNSGLENQSELYIQRSLDAEPEVLLDPNTLSDDGTVALADIDISHDGKYLAYILSASGSDWRDIYIMDVENRIKLADHITDVKFSGAAWYKDGFFYVKYNKSAAENEFTQKNDFPKVYYHKLGTAQEQDILVYQDETNPHRSHYVWASEDEDMVFLSVSEQGKRGNELYYKKDPFTKDAFRLIYSNFDASCWTIGNIGSRLYLFTNENAPNNKLIMKDLDDLSADAKVIIPEKDIKLDGASLTGGKIFAQYMVDVIDKVSIYDTDGKYLNDVTLPGLGNVSGFNGKKDDKQVFYTISTMIAPSEIYLYDITTNTSKLFRSSELKYDPNDYESKQVFYPGKDGTKIPMFLVYKKGLKMDGNNPVYLYSYGGFRISMKPSFSASRLILLENGGIYAMPCIRGGSEYGEKWHEAGMRMNKQNVFDDFITAAEYLIAEKYTNPQKIAVAGGSNGGLLIGAVINQRPDLFRVAFPAVGVMDMLRFQKFTIGSAWITEYGSSDESAEMFKYLLGYSPLHNIKPGVNYPSTMVTTADHDDRVVPSHSFKYISTLQDIYKGNNPVIIRIDTKAGHGSGKPTAKIIEEHTDMWSFMFWNMGIENVY